MRVFDTVPLGVGLGRHRRPCTAGLDGQVPRSGVRWVGPWQACHAWGWRQDYYLVHTINIFSPLSFPTNLLASHSLHRLNNMVAPSCPPRSGRSEPCIRSSRFRISTLRHLLCAVFTCTATILYLDFLFLDMPSRSRRAGDAYIVRQYTILY